MNLVDLLRTDGSGHGVVDNRVAAAPGSWAPVGVMIHHTASKHLDVRGLQKGYSFPGPLCNVGIAREGTRHVITDGRANDSGNGSATVLNDVRADRPVTRDARDRGLADTVSGNPYFYDIEVVNNGIGQDYPPVQIESLAATCAAICRAHGWGPNRVIHHRQWTRRKVDMSWRGDITPLVAQLLDHPQEEDMSDVVKGIQRALGVKDDGDFGPVTEGALTEAMEAARLLAPRAPFLAGTADELLKRGARPSSLGHVLDHHRAAREAWPDQIKPGP